MSSAAAPLSLSRPFILRPVATSLLMLAVLIAGLLAWRQLPVSALPQVDYPVMQVFTFQPGASPDVTARTVTAPLERRLGQIPGLSQMSSTSSGGASVITLKFALEVDLGVAEQDVQAALQSANSLLPSDLPAPPIYRKVNPADVPILTLAIGSDTLPLPRVVDMVDTRMAASCRACRGWAWSAWRAGSARPSGCRPTAARWRPMASRWKTLRTAIAAANNNQPKGSFDGQLRSTMLDANDQLALGGRVPAPHRGLARWRAAAPGRCGPGGRGRGRPLSRGLGRHGLRRGQTSDCGLAPAVLLNIQRQPGANVIDVADQVRALLPQLTATLPANVKVQIVSDRTESIRASVRDVQKELLFAIAPRGAGHLRVPAHAAGHADPQRGGAALAGGHLRGHAVCWAIRSTT